MTHGICQFHSGLLIFPVTEQGTIFFYTTYSEHYLKILTVMVFQPLYNIEEISLVL